MFHHLVCGPCRAVSFNDQPRAVPCRVIFVAFLLRSYSVACHACRVIACHSSVACHGVPCHGVSWRVMFEGLMYREGGAARRGAWGGGGVCLQGSG